MQIKTIRASEHCILDSNVYSGGGTDQTEAIQSLLDIAKVDGGVHLIMDGAALISHLDVYDNTTIECLSKDCGFYQKDHSDHSIIRNAIASKKHIVAHNITLVGGTYNQNCANQIHDRPLRPGEPIEGEDEGDNKWIFGLEFFGVENLTIRDCIVRDFRTFSVTVGCFKNVTIENVWLDLPGYIYANNQDGFHFWGPGQFLTVRNVGGRVGDDFMNIGPDEIDCVSSITDVLVDGVFLDHADQAIRVLSRGTGKIDRLTVRNVTGTYRSFGFYINAWFPDVTCGQFGDMFFENIDLKQEEANYHYRPPMLFNVGGEIRSLICKNIRHMEPIDHRAIFELGLPFYDTYPETIDTYEYPGIYPHIDYFELDGLTILENGEDAKDAEYIQVFGLVDTMVVRHVTAIKNSTEAPNSVLVSMKKRADVHTLIMDSVVTRGMKTLIDDKTHVDDLIQNNLIEK